MGYKDTPSADGQVLYTDQQEGGRFTVDRPSVGGRRSYGWQVAPRYIRQGGGWCSLDCVASLLGDASDVSAADNLEWLGIRPVTDINELEQLEIAVQEDEFYFGSSLVQLWYARPSDIIDELNPIEPAHGWQSFTCCASLAGTSHSGMFYELRWKGWAVAVVVEGAVRDSHYPSRWAKSPGSSRQPPQEGEREKILATMLRPLTKQYDSLTSPYLQQLKEGVPEDLYAYHPELKETVKKSAAFIANTPMRAITDATQRLHLWVKGYYTDLPFEVAARQYERSVAIENARAAAKLEHTLVTSTRTARARKEGLLSPGPTIGVDHAKQYYKMSRAELSRHEAAGKVKAIRTNSRIEWSLEAVHAVSAFSHLPLQGEDEVPTIRVTHLDPFIALIDDLASKYGPASTIVLEKRVSDWGLNLFAGRQFVYDIKRSLAQIRRSTPPSRGISRTTTPAPATRREQAAQTVNSSGRRIRVLTPSLQSRGLADFKHILENHPSQGHSAALQTVPIGSKDNAIIKAIEAEQWEKGDILCLVRGGGDMLHETMRPFHNFDAAIALRDLGKKGVIIVTGIGHSGDNFVVHEGADFPEITPTEAAHRVIKILESA